MRARLSACSQTPYTIRYLEGIRKQQQIQCPRRRHQGGYAACFVIFLSRPTWPSHATMGFQLASLRVTIRFAPCTPPSAEVQFLKKQNGTAIRHWCSCPSARRVRLAANGELGYGQRPTTTEPEDHRQDARVRHHGRPSRRPQGDRESSNSRSYRGRWERVVLREAIPPDNRPHLPLS